MNHLDSATYDRIRSLVRETSGIALKGDRMSLVSARLSRRMRELALSCPREYLEYLHSDASGRELTLLIDAMSTNTTYFFRERQHFDTIPRLFDRWLAAGQRRFRVWSAACSTGEEPYSLAMTLIDRLEGADLRILATDISTRALRSAIEGTYTEKDVAKIPRQLLTRHLVKQRHPDGVTYTATDAVKQRILFRYLNLAEMPLPLRGPLDLILCRNVMIYFEESFRQRLVAEFYRLLKPGGYLIVSHSESLVRTKGQFAMSEPSVYLKRKPGHPVGRREEAV